MKTEKRLKHIRDLDIDIDTSCDHNHDEVVKARDAKGVVLNFFLYIQKAENRMPPDLTWKAGQVAASGLRLSGPH